MQVADRRPDPSQFVTHFLERPDEGIEIARFRVVEQGGELLPMCCDKLLERRQRVLGLDEIELRQIRSIEKRVRH